MNSPTASVISLETARAEAHPWAKPRPLAVPPPPRLDLGKCIPPALAPFREFCGAVAESLQVPPDAVPPLALALASIGTSRALELQLAPQWRETAPLWFAVLAEPGERKSALLSLLAAPVHTWQKEEQDYLRPALAAHDERRRLIESRLVGVRGKLQRATGPEVAKLEREALELSASLENMPAVAAPALVTSNATPEAIRDLLTRNGEKIALVSAETDAGQLLGSRYSKTGTANLDLFLAALTGDPCPSHRIGRDMPLTRPALVMALCVQPQALAEVLRDPVARGRGFVDRLCLIAPPSRMGTRTNHPAEIPPALLRWWADALRRLLKLAWPGRVILTAAGPTRSEAPPHTIQLTPEARNILDVLRNEIEGRIGEAGDLRPVCGYASKLPGVVGRLALTLEAMQDPAATTISGETMRAACEWAPFLLSHFRTVLGDAGASEEIKLARRVLSWCKRHGRTEASAREIQQAHDGNGLRIAELTPALELLVEREWLRECEPPATGTQRTGRPPSPRYAVNPATHDTA